MPTFMAGGLEYTVPRGVAQPVQYPEGLRLPMPTMDPNPYPPCTVTTCEEVGRYGRGRSQYMATTRDAVTPEWAISYPELNRIFGQRWDSNVITWRMIEVAHQWWLANMCTNAMADFEEMADNVAAQQLETAAHGRWHPTRAGVWVDDDGEWMYSSGAWEHSKLEYPDFTKTVTVVGTRWPRDPGVTLRHTAKQRVPRPMEFYWDRKSKSVRYCIKGSVPDLPCWILVPLGEDDDDVRQAVVSRGARIAH